jgi:hypothetical protein
MEKGSKQKSQTKQIWIALQKPWIQLLDEEATEQNTVALKASIVHNSAGYPVNPLSRASQPAHFFSESRSRLEMIRSVVY